MSQPITKEQLRKRLGATDAGVAEFFGISRAAVAQWAEDEPIPELRQLQARAKRPELWVELESPAGQPQHAVG